MNDERHLSFLGKDLAYLSEEETLARVVVRIQRLERAFLTLADSVRTEEIGNSPRSHEAYKLGLQARRDIRRDLAEETGK